MAYWDNFSWQSSSSPITTLLEKDDVTLEQVLDEDQLLSELRSVSPKLIEYLSKPDTMHNIIDILTKPISDNDDEAKQYRYPYLCSEIIRYESPSIQEQLVKEDSLTRLFSFLDGAAPLNSLLLSYFNSIFSHLITKKTDPVLEFLQKKEGFLTQSMAHIYSPAISEILMKFITCGQEEAVDKWFASEDLVPKLIAKMDPEETLAVHENVASVLTCICTNSFQRINSGQNEPLLFSQLNQEQSLTHLVDAMFKKPASSSLTQGYTVFVVLCTEYHEGVDTIGTVGELPPVFRTLVSALPKIKNCLEHPTEESINTTCGELQVPFGFYRMSALELLQGLLSCGAVCVFKAALEQNLFATIFDLFFAFQWNNFVHNAVTGCAQALLKTNDDDIIMQFINQTTIHEKIGESGETPNVNGENSSRKGFMGHIGNLATSLHSASEVSDTLADTLNKCNSWKKYLQEDFATTKKIEAASLGSKSADEEGDVDQLITQYQEVTKRSFEDDFPDSFTPSNDESFDILIRPTDNKLFVGINTDEEEFGKEFDSDDEDNFMGSDEDEYDE